MARLTLRFGGPLLGVVKRLAVTRGTSIPEIFRRAVAVYAYFIEARLAGKRIYIIDPAKPDLLTDVDLMEY
jgi:hypothetical protein